MIKTKQYQITFDNSSGLIEGPFWGLYVRSRAEVLKGVEDVAAGHFIAEFFCEPEQVKVFSRTCDETEVVHLVTIEGPTGPRYEKCVPIPEPLIRMMIACETFCVVSCCDLDAFDISAAPIREWAQKAPAGVLEKAEQQLDELMEALAPVESERFSNQLGFSGNGKDWVAMLGRWKEAIKAAKLPVAQETLERE